ncbi:cytochrome P450 [Guyanagaster necrorhizus]|uniref:Cytochrome P450 n=1 Tax=Guyanagaster necrorhizus TaxID=856835 RepID=A0A9P8AN51_9AGAR|nr:cytochrome P450 [Guyanagaster necrorhizus MCA 3950]KAG7441948.1 cytochrome P450 [Guyanagaster necrorhizus MCA 3950]
MDWNLFLYTAPLWIFVWLFRRRLGLARQESLPPGPSGDPIIGHLRIIPPVGQPEAFHEWAKSYGDVMYLEVLGRKMVILDSMEAANDLLDKRSANYSCRPNFVIYNLMGWDRVLSLMPYGKRFHRHRKLFQTHFGRQECREYLGMQQQEAIVLVKGLMDRPGDYDAIVGRFSAVIILKIAYGYRMWGEDDPLMKLIVEMTEALNNSGPPTSTPPEFFPWLSNFPSWFPGAYYAGYARKNRAIVERSVDYPFDIVRRQMADGTASPSFAAAYLNDLGSVEDEEDYLKDVKGAAAQIYTAGADTSWATLLVFLVAMVLHPEVQEKAQAEIDAVVGSDRLPTFEDRASLPYIDHVLQETMRWNPVLPMGLPHRSMEDDVYRGMFIPKGSVVFANVRGMGLDENVYDQATTFNPDRYLPKPQGKGEPYLAAFGFGRRICPGRYLAENGMWIAIACILATCKITKAKDENGEEINPAVEFSNGIVK